jgi:hypothetical protein
MLQAWGDVAITIILILYLAILWDSVRDLNQTPPQPRAPVPPDRVIPPHLDRVPPNLSPTRGPSSIIDRHRAGSDSRPGASTG